MNEPLDLTFGVELEFVIRVLPSMVQDRVRELNEMLADYDGAIGPRQAVYFDISETLRSISLEVYPFTVRALDRGYEKWTVDHDSSIIPRQGINEKGPLGKYTYIPIEVKSRVLLFDDFSLTEIRKAVTAINLRHNVTVNSSCGLHVHVGNLKRGFPLQTLRNFSTFVAAFERQLSTLHDSDRLHSSWAVPLSASSSLAGLSRLGRARALTQVRDLSSLVRLVNPCFYRHTAYNLLHLVPLDSPKALRTVEFRQHAATMEPARIVPWIQVAAGLVRFAHCAGPLAVTRLVVERANDPDFDVVQLLRAVGLGPVASYYRRRLQSELLLTPVDEQDIVDQERPPSRLDGWTLDKIEEHEADS